MITYEKDFLIGIRQIPGGEFVHWKGLEIQIGDIYHPSHNFFVYL